MRLFDESAPARGRAVTRLSLGASPAVLGAMLALQPQVAQAQAFQGTETVILGNVSRITSGNTDIFTVNALQNTINWTPTDTGPGPAPINFLPTGANAIFTAGPGTNGANYTVLNRIIAADQSRAIAFSGNVTAGPDGRIWFYAPGGLLLNAGSQFDVGGLLLTANDPVGAAAGQPYLSATNQFQLRAAGGSTAGVTINAGATITSDSYMIAVAPRFDMNGAVTVGPGASAALVAAEDVSFTLNGGLFDITANVGTTAGGISSVGGSITGPGGLGGQGIYSRIYAMAVPRNNAMTLLIAGGSQLGFAVANAVDVDGNAVVLSGGYDIVGTPFGQGTTQFGALPVAGSNADAIVRVANSTLTSSLTMRSKTDAHVFAATGAASFASDLQLYADSSARVEAVDFSLTVAGNLLVDASTQLTGLTAGASRTAGTALIITGGTGTVQVTGDILALANGFGDEALSPGLAGGTGTGGTVIVNPTSGSVRAANMLLQADGVGGTAQDGNGGSGIGGTVLFETDTVGSVLLTGNLTINANAAGATGSAGRLSGNAQAGQASVNVLNGSFTVPGSLSVTANAFFIEESVAPHQAGGTATGGTARIDVAAGASLSANNIDLTAFADAGNGAGAGNSFVGGTAIMAVNGNGSATAPGGLYIDASARASDGQSGGNPNGGSATGGFAQLFATGNPLLSFGNDETTIVADARGGNGLGGVGGNAFGGRANVDLQNGGSLLIGNNLLVSAESFGGNGTVGGNAVGRDQGDANPPAVFVRLGPNVGVNDQGIQVNGLMLALAGAQGGNGSTGNGGNATGGFVVVRGQSGTISATSLQMAADAIGGQGVAGGAARSGRLFAGFNDANLTTTALTLNLNADGGNATSTGAGGPGGDATVGQLLFFMDSLEAGPGTTVNAGAVTLLAAAQGGGGGDASAGSAGAGGNAFGIDPNATDNNLVIVARPARSSFTATNVIVDNTATGGQGGIGLGTANGGRGGNAAGGQINIGTASGPVTPTANRSTFDFGALYRVDGRVTGGNGGTVDGDGVGGRGGDATGGGASLLARGSVVTAGTVNIDTSAFAGNGGGGGSSDLGGGNGRGGDSIILATPHFTAGLPVDVTITGPVALIATGAGGASQLLGGQGQGGSASVRLQRHEAAGAAPVSTVGSMNIAGAVLLDAGSEGGAAIGNGAIGGEAVGGDVDIIGEGGPLDLISGAQLRAVAFAASGAPGAIGQAGGAGGAASGGTATVTVRPGGIITTPSLDIDVSALAGLGGNGGAGAAGAAPANPLPGQRDGNPGGNGGTGAVGGVGGDALGGNITIGTPSTNSGGELTIGSWTLRGEALAGVGGGGGTGGNGANGGNGLDGDTIFINGGNGGAGGNGGQGGNAGNGGNATGGRLLIGAGSNDLGNVWTLNVPVISASMGVTAGASGAGGPGGSPGAGGAGGAAGTPPGVAGQPGAAGLFFGSGFDALPGLAEGAVVQALLFNANFTAPGIDLSADATGAPSTFGGQAGDGRAGNAELVISGGNTVLNYARLSAIGSGGTSTAGNAGAGRGGQALFSVLDGANVTLGARLAPVELVAQGIGGDGLDGGSGGSGQGGTVRTTVAFATLQVNGDLVMTADAVVGDADFFASADGGGAQLLFDEGSTLGVTGRLLMTGSANGWAARGGSINITGFGNGQLLVEGDTQLIASVALDSGQASASGTAGGIEIRTSDGNTLQIDGSLFADAGLSSFDVSLNPRGAGGLFAWDHRGTATIGGTLQANAGAFFGDGAGGEAFGGSIAITTFSGTLTTAGLSLSADADGGFVNGGTPAAAIGGSVLLRAEAGTSLFSTGGPVSLTANGTGSSNGAGPGGAGLAGTVSLGSQGTLELDMGGSGSFALDAIGKGGESFNGEPGGTGTGGGIDLNVGTGGTLNIINPASPPILLRASGIGGNSVAQGGTGNGGNIVVQLTEGTFNAGSLSLNVRGEGGTGLPSGNATAGRAQFVVTDSLAGIGGDLIFLADLFVPGSSLKGDGTGGQLLLDVRSSGRLDVAGNLQMLANGDGSANVGGEISLAATSGLLNVAGSTTLSAVSFNDTANANTVIQAGTVLIDVGAAGEVRSAGGMTIDVTAAGSAPAFGVDANAGVVFFQSNGRVQIGGAGLSMFGNAFWTTPGGLGGNAQGGTIELFAGNGTFESTSLSMQANAGGGVNPGGIGGFGFGGTVTLSISDPAVLTLSAPLSIAANGFGGNGDTGGEGNGGDILAVIDNGSIDQLGQELRISAVGRGGDGASGPGGEGFGGDIIFGPGNLTVTSTVPVETLLIASARGGASTSGVGGFASGGSIDVFPDVLVQGRSLALPGGLSLVVSAAGGVGAAGTGGAEGGNATFDWELGPVTLAGELFLDASASGFNAVGGSATASGDRGPLVATGARFRAVATGTVEAGNGGSAQGGDVSLDLFRGATASFSGDVQLFAFGAGGIGNAGAGGAATGGAASLTLEAAGTSLTATNLIIDVQGSGGQGLGGIGGAGQGGTALVELTTGAQATITGNLTMRASGFGGSGLVGGQATGGAATILAQTGAQLLGAAFVQSIGAGAVGGAGSAGAGGAALGGATLIQADSGASIDLGRISLGSATATGGQGSGTGDGGAAVSGSPRIIANGGIIDIAGIDLWTASANGGNATGTGAGGLADAGDPNIQASNGGTITIVATGGTTGVSVTAAGAAGNSVGGRGGDGFGGVVSVNASGGSQITLDGQAASNIQVSLRARGIGGNGASGGTGTGGRVTVATGFDAGMTLAGATELVAEATGGTASGGSGGDALSGRVTISMQAAVDTTSITTGDLTILAGATAGNGSGILGRGGNAAPAMVSGVFIGSGNNRGTINLGNVNLELTATGGAGGNGPTNDGGAGGNATAAGFGIGFRALGAGGSVGGTITTGLMQIDARALGGAGGVGSSADGAGGNGGNALGGALDLTTFGGSLRIAPNATAIGLRADTSAVGGAGGSALIGGNGGSGLGGAITMGSLANAQAAGQLGQFVSSRQQISADGEGGAGFIGGEARAGAIALRALEGTALVNGRIDWSATAIGGESTGGVGGLAVGGGFDLLGNATVTASALIDGSARGGNGSTGGGEARGARAALAGNLTLQNGFEVFVTADGGNATGQGTGGLATGGQVDVTAADTETMTITGFAEIFADTRGGSGVAGGDATGANVRLRTTGPTATLDVGGIVVRSNGFGGDGGVLGPQTPARAGNASDGAITVESRGTMRVRGDLVLQQSRDGGTWLSDSGNGGSARGGNITVAGRGDPNLGGGMLIVDGELSLRANATGGSVDPQGIGAGGSADGTVLTLSSRVGGDVQFANGVSVQMRSFGGTGSLGVGGRSSGARFVTSIDDSQLIIGGPGLNASLASAGGDGSEGGIGNGGVFDLFVDFGRLDVAGDTSIETAVLGGNGGDGGIGGEALGGLIRILMNGPDNGSALSLSPTGRVNLNANSEGGRGGDGGNGGNGGDAVGGSIELGATGSTGTVTLGDVVANVFARAGAGGDGTTGGNGGGAFGGAILVGMAGNTAGPAGVFSALSADLFAGGAGGSGGAGSTLGQNGSAIGGSVALQVRGANGSVAGNVDLSANATGGGFGAGPATGGVIELSSEGGSNGVAGDFAIAGNVVAEATSTGTPATSGVVRVFAVDGSRLAMGSLETLVNGTQAPASPERGGLVAGVGSTIAIAGSASLVSPQSLGLNDGGTITAGGRLSVSSAQQLLSGFDTPTPGAVGTIAATTLDLAGNSGVSLATNTTGSGDVLISSAAGSVVLGDIAAIRSVGLLAQGALTSGAVTSGRDLVLLSGGTITTGALATPATGRIRVDDIAQRSLISFPGGVPDYTALFAAAPTARAGDTIINGNLTTGLFEARSTGLLQVAGTINAAIGARLNVRSLQIGSTSTPGFLDLTAVDSLVLADLNAQGQISLASDGSITAGNVTTGQSLVLAANRPGATLTTGNVRADGEIRLSSNTTLTTGSLSSGNRVFLTAGGPIVTGAIDAGTVNPQAGASGVLFATSPGTIRTGPINVSGSATLSGVLGVTTGNVAAPGGIVLLDTGGINAGNLTTSPSGFVYIAAHDLLPQITFDQAGNPQFAALLASTPIRLVGDINLRDVSTGRFIAAATGNFFVNNATASTSMLVDVGGFATLDFNINTPSLTVTSSDIGIDPLAAVGAAGGSIVFNTTGATTVIVGGAGAAAVPGTYRLSNGEFGALRASSIVLRSGNTPMTVDQLALPAIAPGQAANPGVTLRTDGTMRVTGAVTMAQAGADNRLNLTAGTRIEVVQGSGSVRLGAGVDTPAGTLALTAPRIWVASDSLLTQLAGTTLTGQARIDAVNAPGAPTVVGGSIGAGTILIGTGEELLIQNSGTDLLKAGFTAGTGGLRIRRAFEGTNPIPVVINGRIQRADNSFAVNSDTLPLVQLDPGISLVTATSTVNGCLIVTANCPGLLLEELQQPVVTIVNNVEALTPEEEAQREAAQEAAEKLPIVLLQRLIDFSPLFVDPDATDPVTSGGNPALWMDPMPRGVRAPGGLK